MRRSSTHRRWHWIHWRSPILMRLLHGRIRWRHHVRVHSTTIAFHHRTLLYRHIYISIPYSIIHLFAINTRYVTIIAGSLGMLAGGGGGAGLAGASNTCRSLMSDPRNTTNSKTFSDAGISSSGLPRRPSVPNERTTRSLAHL